MQATRLLQHTNPPQNKSQTSQVQCLQVLKSNKILFITSDQLYSFTFARIEKHSQYEFKLPYNIMQATRLFQHNNPPQNQSQTSQVQCLQVLKSNKVIFITSN